ncbi:hypothetical protein [Burkholderia pseudomallei]|uniref:hypothetical protein n=1 Tax=Burkholderia pseudomallei TaxID=28450 RepID=UPI000A1A1494|nr:hypothetical protein [Burkholderia pseudomallei]ARL38877.1 hypothetical protein BOC49_21780 [Burkholderia pseudomallei]
MIAMRRILLRASFAAPLAFAALAAPSNAPADARTIVDLFPAQHWAALGAPPAEPEEPRELPERLDPDSFGEAADPAQDSARVAPPFTVTGEWREGDSRIVVLEGGPEMRLLCERRCDVRGAVGRGDEVAPGYRLKRLTDRDALIVDANGAEFALPLPGAAP